MKLIGLGENLLIDPREQMKSIYDGYINTLPNQTNLFDSIVKTNRTDMLDNAGDVDRQMIAVRNSLSELYSRYGYTSIEIQLKFNPDDLALLVDITAINPSKIPVKLSEALILETK